MAYGGQGDMAQRGDWDDGRREAQARFDSEYGEWRIRRGEQRAAVGRARTGMEVVGADGGHVGTVARTSGDRIVLATGAGVGQTVPCDWVNKVHDRVVLNLAAAEARARRESEEPGRGLQRLNRGFADSYPAGHQRF